MGTSAQTELLLSSLEGIKIDSALKEIWSLCGKFISLCGVGTEGQILSTYFLQQRDLISLQGILV